MRVRGREKPFNLLFSASLQLHGRYIEVSIVQLANGTSSNNALKEPGDSKQAQFWSTVFAGV